MQEDPNTGPMQVSRRLPRLLRTERGAREEGDQEYEQGRPGFLPFMRCGNVGSGQTFKNYQVL